MTAPPKRSPQRHLARIVFFVFLITFIASRVLVILIMGQHLPDLFFHMGGTHVHHLNYGIFLLAGTGALQLFVPLSDRQREWVAGAYACGLALTFDEFGMWLHLGGSYWQRASYDAVIVVLAGLGLAAFAPAWRRVGTIHYAAASTGLVAVALFAWLSFQSLNYVERKVGPHLRALEERGPQ